MAGWAFAGSEVRVRRGWGASRGCRCRRRGLLPDPRSPHHIRRHLPRRRRAAHPPRPAHRAQAHPRPRRALRAAHRPPGPHIPEPISYCNTKSNPTQALHDPSIYVRSPGHVHGDERNKVFGHPFHHPVSDLRAACARHRAPPLAQPGARRSAGSRSRPRSLASSLRSAAGTRRSTPIPCSRPRPGSAARPRWARSNCRLRRLLTG